MLDTEDIDHIWVRRNGQTVHFAALPIPYGEDLEVVRQAHNMLAKGYTVDIMTLTVAECACGQNIYLDYFEVECSHCGRTYYQEGGIWKASGGSSPSKTTSSST